MSGHRQAAVALYNLDDADQGAILSELPAADQKILRELLAELAQLGFAKAANSADMATPHAAAEPDGLAVVQARRVLKRASAPAMMAILGREPASLLAAFLALEAWPWSDAFIEMLPPARRTLVREALRTETTSAPARARFLIESVSAALADTPGAPVSPVRRAATSLTRLLPWTR